MLALLHLGKLTRFGVWLIFPFALLFGCAAKPIGRSAEIRVTESPLKRALRSEALLSKAQRDDPTLFDALSLFNKKSELQRAVFQSSVPVGSEIRRVAIFRHLRLGRGIDNGKLAIGTPYFISSRTLIIYQDKSGWGYLSDFDLTDWNGLIDVESLPLFSGVVSEYILNENGQPMLCDEIANSLASELASNLDGAENVSLLKSSDSWDGASVDVFGYFEVGKFATIAGINVSQNPKLEKAMEGILMLRNTLRTAVAVSPK